MVISPQDTLAIGATVTLLSQVTKRALPGDWDAYGVQICGFISLVSVITWVAQQGPITYTPPLFDWLTLWASIWSTSAGGYELSKMATSVGGRSVQKLRAVRDAKRDETVPEQAA